MKRSCEVEVQTSRSPVTIEAYRSNVEGLVAHREVLLTDSDEQVELGNKWTLSHVGTGLSVLSGEHYQDTKRACYQIADQLRSYDWNTDDIPEGVDKKAILEAVERSESAPVTRFVINPVEGEYAVVNTATNKEIERHAHRGVANARRVELEEESNA